MKRERALQVVLVLVGLFYSFWGYLLFDDLWHSRWLSGRSDVMPMFLSLNTALGVCLLVAAKQPAHGRHGFGLGLPHQYVRLNPFGLHLLHDCVPGRASTQDFWSINPSSRTTINYLPVPQTQRTPARCQSWIL
jgi:hypothetical protein